MNSVCFSAATASSTEACGGLGGGGSTSPGTCFASVAAVDGGGMGRGFGRTKACQITRTATESATARRARRSISGHRVEAARVKWVAAGNTPDAQEESTRDAVAGDRLGGINGAGRM